MKWDGNTERRRHRRAPIRIYSEFGDPGASTRVETADFSAGGFACWMDHPIQPLTKLALRFDFPGFADETGRSMDCEAIVVRCERRRTSGPGWSVAAAFVGLPDNDRAFITRYVQWHDNVVESGGEDAPAEPRKAPGNRAS
jgi:hypothetical protein